MLYYHHFFLFLSLFPEPPSGWSNFQPRGNLPKATSFRVKNRSKTNQKQFNFIFILNELILLSFSPQISWTGQSNQEPPSQLTIRSATNKIICLLSLFPPPLCPFPLPFILLSSPSSVRNSDHPD